MDKHTITITWTNQKPGDEGNGARGLQRRRPIFGARTPQKNHPPFALDRRCFALVPSSATSPRHPHRPRAAGRDAPACSTAERPASGMEICESRVAREAAPRHGLQKPVAARFCGFAMLLPFPPPHIRPRSGIEGVSLTGPQGTVMVALRRVRMRGRAGRGISKGSGLAAQTIGRGLAGRDKRRRAWRRAPARRRRR